MTNISYTCHKCQVQFSSRVDANKHYSEKWHQYNLMRCMKNLPVIPQESYQKLMNKSTFLQDAKNRVNVINCSACKKNFTSQGSYETHQRSRKHKQNVVRKAAENVRRVQIQIQKESLRTKAIPVMAVGGEGQSAPADDDEEGQSAPDDDNEEVAVAKGTQYCTACKAAFASEKDFKKHAETLKHKISLKAAKLAEERQQELDRQDEVHDTGDDDNEDMEVEEVDSDEWDEEEGEKVDVEDMSVPKPLPVSTCLFCGKKSANLTSNLGHMERQHSFIVPHQKAGDLEKLQAYLGEKIGEHFQCLECSKEFTSLRACRLHMLDKPHLAIRFEGEYDAFFDVSKIMAEISLPVRPAENDYFAFPLPNGTFLTHRDLRRYFKQRPSQLAATLSARRLRGPGAARAITTHLKGSSEANSILAIKKSNESLARKRSIMHKIKDKKYLDVAVKANKLQTHFRQQVQNAG